MKWKKNRYLYLTLIIAFGLFYSCEKVAIEPIKVGAVSFSTDIQPIFTTNNCVACHGGSQAPDLRPDVVYNSLKNGGYVNLTTPKDSRVYKQLYTSSHSSRASDVDKQKILQWIIQGAKND